MPTNQLAPPDMPWLTGGPPLRPNSLGPPLLNYAAPPDATTSQGADVLAGKAQQAWQWLQDQRAESVRQGLLDPDTGLPTQKGVVEGARATAEGVMMGTTAPGDVPPPGIVVYHGSPADFNRFDDRFIGTGEGAQAYGRGHYFAGKEGVAQSYKGAGPAANAQLDAINTQLSQLSKQMDQYSTGQYGKYNDPKGYELKAQYDALMDQRANLGHMYQVNIGADPEHFLDYDQPVPADHPVRDMLFDASGPHVNSVYADMRNAGKDARLAARNDNLTGNGAYHQLSKLMGGPEQATITLRDAGIPGIRYADQGSRFHVTEAGDLERKISMRDQLGLSQQDVDAAQARLQELQGKISRNYVVFDPATIEILRKYGIAGLIAGGGAAAAGMQQQPPSQ